MSCVQMGRQNLPGTSLPLPAKPAENLSTPSQRKPPQHLNTRRLACAEHTLPLLRETSPVLQKLEEMPSDESVLDWLEANFPTQCGALAKEEQQGQENSPQEFGQGPTKSITASCPKRKTRDTKSCPKGKMTMTKSCPKEKRITRKHCLKGKTKMIKSCPKQKMTSAMTSGTTLWAWSTSRTLTLLPRRCRAVSALWAQEVPGCLSSLGPGGARLSQPFGP